MAKMAPHARYLAGINDFDETAAFAANVLREHGMHFSSIDLLGGWAYMYPEPMAARLSDWKPLDRLPEQAGIPAVRQEAERLALRERAYVGGLDTIGNRVRLCAMPPAVYERVALPIAEGLGTDTWEVPFAVKWHPDGRIDTITVFSRAGNRDPEKRLVELHHIVKKLPGGSNGWTIDQDTENSVTTLTWGAPLSLPAAVSLDEVAPINVTPEQWGSSYFGRDSSGRVAGHRLTDSPHTFVAGKTGSGKTATIQAMLSRRLLCGHEVVIVDPTKGVDWFAFEQFALFIAEDYEQSERIMDWLLEEMLRRKAVLKSHRAVKWLDLPDDVRAAEGIGPLTVVADELHMLLKKAKENTALDKNSPKRQRQAALVRAKAVIDDGLNELAAAARYVGIFLILATQKALVANLGEQGSTLRENCGNAVYLQAPGKPVSKKSMDLLFDELAEVAAEQIHALDDKHSMGLALTGTEDGAMAALRAAYIPAEEVELFLLARGLQPREPMQLPVSGHEEGPRELAPARAAVQSADYSDLLAI